MALKVIRELPLKLIKGSRIFYSNCDIQNEFCSTLEMEDLYEHEFFEDQKVLDYLKGFGITYCGGYRVSSPEWGSDDDDNSRFITFLNYPVQLGCLIRYKDYKNVVIQGSSLYHAKYMIPILKERDILLVVGNRCIIKDLLNTFKEGIDVYLDGELYNRQTISDQDFFGRLLDYDSQFNYLTREIEAEFFNPEMFKPEVIEETTLSEFIKSDSRSEEYSELGDMVVKANGSVPDDSDTRRLPIHLLFKVGKQWVYTSAMSVKYPTRLEILEDSIFDPEFLRMHTNEGIIFDSDLWEQIDEVFSLVLDCNEICDAREFWKYVYFIADYRKSENALEFCKRDDGLLRFHELLQKSIDFRDWIKRSV